MKAQHGRPQGNLSARRKREGEHHSKAIDLGSKRGILAESKIVARFIYGSHSDFLRRQHLQDVLSASGTLPSLEVATPSIARTHFCETSRPRLFLRATRLPPRERELSGDVRRIMQLEQHANALAVRHILRSTLPAMRTVCMSTPSSPAHREVAILPAARTVKMTASLPSLRLGTAKRRDHALPSALSPTPPRNTNTLGVQDLRPWGLQPD